MSCKTELNKNGVAVGGGDSFSLGVQDVDQQNFNPPSEIFGTSRTLSASHDEAVKLALTRGQHKIKALIPYEKNNAVSIDNVLKKLDIEGEFKRVFFHKIDIRPIEGEDKAVLTATFHVLDNPIPVIPIVWGASIVASATAGVFFIDKVESFSNSFGGIVSIGIALVVGYFTIFK